MSEYKLTPGTSIIRVLDGACIPADPDNMDYQEYLTWLAEENIPAPITEATTLTKAQRITALNDKYAPRFQTLQLNQSATVLANIDLITGAINSNGIANLILLATQFQDLQNQKLLERKVILSAT